MQCVLHPFPFNCVWSHLRFKGGGFVCQGKDYLKINCRFGDRSRMWESIVSVWGETQQPLRLSHPSQKLWHALHTNEWVGERGFGYKEKEKNTWGTQLRSKTWHIGYRHWQSHHGNQFHRTVSFPPSPSPFPPSLLVLVAYEIFMRHSRVGVHLQPWGTGAMSLMGSTCKTDAVWVRERKTRAK